MKKVLVLLLVIALVMVFMMPVATAKGHNVDVCHVNGANDTAVIEIFGGPVLLIFGEVISVSGNGNAPAAHEAHGDRVWAELPSPFFGTFNYFDDAHTTEFFEEGLGISLPNADCWFGVPVPA